MLNTESIKEIFVNKNSLFDGSPYSAKIARLKGSRTPFNEIKIWDGIPCHDTVAWAEKSNCGLILHLWNVNLDKFLHSHGTAIAEYVVEFCMRVLNITVQNNGGSFTLSLLDGFCKKPNSVLTRS